MLITVPFVTVFYLLMNLSYMVAMVNEEMLSSQAVAITFGKKMLGSFLFIIPLGVTISTFGCALTSQFSTTRYDNKRRRECATINLQTLLCSRTIQSHAAAVVFHPCG